MEHATRHIPAQATLTRSLFSAMQIAGGLLLTGAGAVIAVTPIPLGLPVMAMGLVVLTSCSPACRRTAAGIRRRLRLLDAALVRLEDHAPRAFARLLRQSNPRYHACMAAFAQDNVIR
ncbi:hypothetical protein [Hyphobacterium marinum]|uniref:Uncharacterized protein n=1 Tax=Hyphobacterium marinum TaxID=3116574 RepID=A0ABU7LU36_9PROT|nr:hypothetical protein [Hyphobacterium sp. Y6023]MEE2565049.1 hypothetical protein [Hyphobacterium sp. Y6023]